MKTLIVLFISLISLNSSFAQRVSYYCSLPRYEVDITLADISSHIWITDRSDRTWSFQSYVGFIRDFGGMTEYTFHGQDGEKIVSIPTQVTTQFPLRFRGFFDGTIRGMPMYNSMQCQRRN